MAETMANPFPIPMPANFDFRKAHGVALSKTAEKPGETPIYINAAFPVGRTFLDSNPVFPKTAYETFNVGLNTSGDSPCLGRREWDSVKGDWADKYTWETYKETASMRDKVGSGLVKLAADGAVDAPSAKGWSVGLWCVNRPEWQHVALGCAAYSLVSVSLYDTLGPSVVEFCINHAECRLIVAAPAHIPALLLKAKLCPTLKVIVSVDNWADIAAKNVKPTLQSADALKAWGADVGVKVIDMAELVALGTANPSPHMPPAPSDMASICYTSGTTGNPKGAILNHKLLAAGAVSNLYGGRLDGEGVFVSYLPLSHIYERFCEDVAFAAGAAIGYSCGDNLRLLEDLQILKPTFMVSVPRVLNRVYQSVKASTIDAPGFMGKLTGKAFNDKFYNLKHYNQKTHAFWDRIVFRKVRAALGGNIQFIGSGSAPIAPEVLEFLKVAFSCEVTEGYGQTENCGTAVRCFGDDPSPSGTCGPPQVGVEVKLVDVPDMGYLSTDKPHPRGELCTRGDVVIPGYYKDETKTKETVDTDGWLHSGDVASVDELGRFKIIDRIKNLVKLSQGEYVALEKVENVYGLCPLLAQLYIHGDSLRDHVVGIIVPDPLVFAPFASHVLGKTVAATDGAGLAQAARDPKVKQAVMNELVPYAEKARLAGFERIKALHIHLEPFSVENDLLTPTMKTKRNIAAKYFKSHIEKMYAEAPKKAIAKL